MNGVSPGTFVLEGGTDIASMLIFDPDTLPDGIEVADDPMEIILSLSDAGEICWVNLCADGGYLLGVLLGGDLPEACAKFARPWDTAGRINFPSGRLYFDGLEYAFHDDNSRLLKYPHMGSSCQLPAGVYRMALLEMAYPENFHEDLLRSRLSASAFWLHSLMGWFVPIGCLGVIVAAASIGFTIRFGPRVWVGLPILLPLGAILPAFLLARSRVYRQVKQALKSIHLEHPDFWARLEPWVDDP